MKGRLPRTLSRALPVGGVSSAPPGLPQCPVFHTKPSPTPCTAHAGSVPALQPSTCRSCGSSPGLTCGRPWPRSARTGCAGCSGRTGTAGWRHRWSRPAGGPRTHLRGRGGAQSTPGLLLLPQSPGQGWNPLLTRHVRGMLQVVVGAAVLGALHEVGRLVHVLGGKERTGWPQCQQSAGREPGPAAAQGTHKPHAIEGHLLVEVLHHVVPPLVRLWVGEVWEHRGAWPDLQEGGERWAEPPPSTTAPQRFLPHSGGPAATRALSVGTGAAPHTHLPDQGLPCGVSDEHPSPQALVVGLVGARGPRAADPSVLQGHKARATAGNGQPCPQSHPGAAEPVPACPCHSPQS